MPDRGDFRLSELHKIIRGGERVLTRQLRPDRSKNLSDTGGESHR